MEDVGGTYWLDWLQCNVMTNLWMVASADHRHDTSISHFLRDGEISDNDHEDAKLFEDQILIAQVCIFINQISKEYLNVALIVRELTIRVQRTVNHGIIKSTFEESSWLGFGKGSQIRNNWDFVWIWMRWGCLRFSETVSGGDANILDHVGMICQGFCARVGISCTKNYWGDITLPIHHPSKLRKRLRKVRV